jgi:3'-phosphoadenosine 5'-phosphosulfate sulfotransferase (PAPS reductase)/FAD synthetase
MSLAYKLNAQTLRYKNLLERTERHVEQTLKKYKNISVSFSGGKDSTVLLDIVGKRFDLTVLFIESGCTFPDTYDLIEIYKKKYKIIVENSDYTYQEIFAKRETMKVSDEQWMEWIVYSPAKKFIEKTKTDIQCIGLRSAESRRRALRFKYFSDERVLKKTNVATFYPLKDWTYQDIWSYIETNNLPYNSLYDKYREIGIPDNISRVDTYLECEGYNNSTLDILRIYYPDIYSTVVDDNRYLI